MSHFTADQYEAAIAHLRDAATQLVPNGHGCHVCGDYTYHIEVAITVGPLVKTIDNERDALETIRRLKAKP